MRLNISSQEIGTIPWVKWVVPCWRRSRPWNTTFRSQSGHRRRDSNGSLPRHYSKFQCLLSRKLAADRRICCPRVWLAHNLREVSAFLHFEFVMRPEGVVEGKVAVFATLRVICVVETSQVTVHVHAEFTVEVSLALVEGTHPHTYFYTHK